MTHDSLTHDSLSSESLSSEWSRPAAQRPDQTTLRHWLVLQRNDGHTPAQIATELVAAGWDADTAARTPHRRQQAAENRDGQDREQRVEQDPAVERNLVDAGELRDERANRCRRRPCDQQTEHGADHREQGRLGQSLGSDGPP